MNPASESKYYSESDLYPLFILIYIYPVTIYRLN